ncbi:MAG: 50S ribosomal protein L11 methyltransferase [Gemmatimonadota bacterium]|nr:50S ribosomal protein L11 methyltransferase [Gemmatimonadota bacterium]
MYTLTDYLAMIADRRRTEAYVAAMRAVIRPGDVVVELGTGFGYFAVHAARLGAAHVYAIEPEDVVALGPAFAAANGVADRITFLTGFSTRVTLPARADVCIEDMRGASPLFTQRLPSLLDARARHLSAGARMIPARDRLQLTPAQAPSKLHEEERRIVDDAHGIRFDAVIAQARRGWRPVRARDARPLAPTATWAELDLARFTALSVDGTSEWVVETAGLLDGFVGSFEAELAPGITYATGPQAERMIYDASWFPLEQSIAVVPGDGIAVRMRAVHDGAEYVWAWDTTVTAGDGRFAPVRQKQNNLPDLLRSPERLLRRTATFVPPVTESLAVHRDALALADGTRSVGDIAARLVERHPARFADPRAALRWAADWLAGLEESGSP